MVSEKDRLTQELTLSCGNSMVGGGQLLCIYIYIYKNNSKKQHYTRNPNFFTSFDIYIHIPEVFFFICFFFLGGYFGEMCLFECMIITLPETNSSLPLKIGLLPQNENNHLNQPLILQVQNCC